MKNTLGLGRPARLVAVVLATLLGGLGVLIGTAAPASATTADDEAAFFSMTNSARTSAGLPALANDVLAANIARTWSQSMASTKVLAHNPNLVDQVNAQVTTAWTRLGENVGFGPTPLDVQNAFMASSAHKANILGDFNRLGIGTARDSSNYVWVTVIFIKGPPLSSQPPPETFLPFSSASSLVNQQYLDYLGHAGDSAGINYWSALLNTSAVTPIGVVTAFATSGEAKYVWGSVTRLYMAYFLRLPDFGGLSYWMGLVRAGMPVGAVSDAFAKSSEFTARYGSLTNSEFVSLVYQNVMGRAADPGGLSYWTGMLDTGKMTRGAVMNAFAQSLEYALKMGASVAVVTGYGAMLRRAPDTAGFFYWADKLAKGTPLATFLGGIYSSTEYADRF